MVSYTMRPVSYTHLDVYKRQHISGLDTKKHGSKTVTFEKFCYCPLKTEFVLALISFKLLKCGKKTSVAE